MKIPFQKIVLTTILIFLFSCESEQERLRRAERECASKTSIDGFNISFFGYFPYEADSINIRIKRVGKFILDYSDKIPDEISDSLRHKRNYFVKNEIKLSDTVYLKIKNEPSKVITDFKYLVRPHFSMMKKDWGCDFYELKINGTVSEGAAVNFIKKGSNFIEKEDFKNYYRQKK